MYILDQLIINFNTILGMADFQYDPEPNDPVVLLRDAMNRMDGMTCFFEA